MHNTAFPANDKLDSDFIVESEVMRRFMAMVERVASHSGNVLIIGETGTGKERIAHTIHEHSMRRDKPFVEINCAALPEHLVESELFGYEKGAFSGANANKPGLFEMAQDSTIFLDEIGELDLKVQVKLLRVLDRSPYYRLGGHRKISADVRVVAATNRNLKSEVAAGRFRKDLYHRLAQFELCVPPLRDRSEDIAALVRHIVAQSGEAVQLSSGAMQALISYPWPGNVRELQNVMNKIIFASSDAVIQETDVAEELMRASHDTQLQTDETFGHPRAEVRMDTVASRLSPDSIQKALAVTRGHRGQAAAQLGISRRTLSRKLRTYGFSEPKLPAGMALGSLSDEERQHFRADMKVKVSVVTGDGQELSCTSTNLGMSGMGLEGLHVILTARSALRLCFQLPDTASPIEVEGRIAWADKQGGAGIIFTGLQAGARRHINGWLYQKMAEEGWSITAEATDPISAQFMPASSYTN
jgi:DNA-binding NtrC family response regulator